MTIRRRYERPLLTALIAQGGGFTLALLIRSFAGAAWPDAWLALAMLQGVLAAALSLLLKSPWWWMPIHLVFLPAALILRGLGIAPWWYLVGFALLLLIYGRTDRSRVPLYLSNRITANAVSDLLPRGKARMIDLGCGDAGLLCAIARARADCDFVGIEHAPLTFVWARLRALGLSNVHIRYGDFWREDLGTYDLVYAFLSPVPMPGLWAKARAELGPGALLVSNSFEVPGAVPDQALTLDDRRRTRLLCYRPVKPSAKRRHDRAS
jgi:hypothetical protein